VALFGFPASFKGMIGLKVDESKGLFFDRDRVIGALTKEERKRLSKFGSYTMTSARRRIRTRKRTSRPGESPTNRLGLLKKFIFFVYSPSSRSVIIGPAALNQRNREAPRLLEYGGKGTTSWWITARNPKASKTAHYEARPYMQPSFEENLKKLVPDLWKNSVKK